MTQDSEADPGPSDFVSLYDTNRREEIKTINRIFHGFDDCEGPESPKHRINASYFHCSTRYKSEYILQLTAVPDAGSNTGNGSLKRLCHVQNKKLNQIYLGQTI